MCCILKRIMLNKNTENKKHTRDSKYSVLYIDLNNNKRCTKELNKKEKFLTASICLIIIHLCPLTSSII